MEFPGQAGKKSQDTRLLSTLYPFKSKRFCEKCSSQLGSLPVSPWEHFSSSLRAMTRTNWAAPTGGPGNQEGVPKVAFFPTISPHPHVLGRPGPWSFLCSRGTRLSCCCHYKYLPGSLSLA